MDRNALVELILADLEDILGKTRAAYLERLPRLRKIGSNQLDEVLEATRRTMQSFLRYYAEGTLDGPTWQTVRDATVERAGEIFSHEEILEIISIGRSIAAEAVHHLGELHPELRPEDRDQVSAAIDRYVSELALQEDHLRTVSGPDHLDSVLAALEEEGADLA